MVVISTCVTFLYRSDLWPMRFLTVATLVLLLYLAVCGLNPNIIIFHNDQAASLAVAAVGCRGDVALSGPPASRGGRHWGPYYYYFETLSYWLVGEDTIAAMRLTAITKGLTLFALIFFARLLVRRELTLELLIAFAFSFVAGFWYWVLRVTWHPNFLVLPLVFLFAATHLVLTRGLGWAPLFVFAANLIALSHLAAIPLALALSLAVLLLLLWCDKQQFVHCLVPRRLCLILLPSLLLWIPPLVYEARFGQNLPIVFSRLHTSGSGPSLLEAMELIGTNTIRFTVGEYVHDQGVWLAVQSILLVLMTIIWLLILRRTRSRTLLCLTIAFVGATAMYAHQLSLLRKPIGMHLLFPLAPLSLLIFAIVLAESLHVIRTGQPILPCATTKGVLIYRLLAGSFVAAALALGVPSATVNLQVPFATPEPEAVTLLQAQRLTADIQSDALGSRFLVKVSGRWKHKESAIYFLAGRAFYRYMPESRKLDEFKTIRPFTEAERRQLPRYYLRCEADGLALTEKQARSAKQTHHFTRAVPLNSCSDCAGCAIERWDPKGITTEQSP